MPNLILIVALVILVLLLVLLVSIFNRLVRARVRVDEAWATVNVQIKRRTNLVPNLAATVAGYASHERGTLEAVTRARQRVERAQGAQETGAANVELNYALGRLFVVVERYPDLKAAANFLELQKELSDIEDRIAYARQFYNRCVLDYNAMLGVLPSSVLASAFNFRPRPFFESEDQGLPPEVRFPLPPTSAVPSQGQEP